jgi:hypothetical protein
MIFSHTPQKMLPEGGISPLKTRFRVKNVLAIRTLTADFHSAADTSAPMRGFLKDIAAQRKETGFGQI